MGMRDGADFRLLIRFFLKKPGDVRFFVRTSLGFFMLCQCALAQEFVRPCSQFRRFLIDARRPCLDFGDICGASGVIMSRRRQSEPNSQCDS